ncbi:MAG: response regulator transcription factor [Ruminococcus sp.]|jgi:two-component system response regulator YesN
MLKVLIADDEKHVCKLIEKLIKWDELHLQLVSVVHSGSAALETFRVLRPDIIITDIRMPSLNGIDLIKEIRQMDKDVSFLVISGYRFFDYAYGALKYGAEDYIVKPIKENDINNALKKIIEKKTRAEKLEMENRGYKQEKMIRDLMEFPDKIRKNSDFIQHYHLNLQDNTVTAFILKINLKGQEKIDDNLTVIAEHILHLLVRSMEKAGYSIYTAVYGDMIPVIAEGDILQQTEFREILENMLKEIRQFGDKNINVRACIGMGGAGDISQAGLLLDEARCAVWDQIFEGTEKILKKKRKREVTVVSDELKDQLKNSISSLNYGEIKNMTAQIEAGFIRNRYSVSGRQVYETYQMVMDTFKELLEKLDSESDVLISAENAELKLRMITDFSEVINYMRLMIDQLITKVQNLEENMEKKPIRTAITYINEHYSENMSLETISAVVDLNPVYFSSIFKKETGRNFIEYLTEVRLEQAKTLLLESDYNISEIAWKVGYQDEKYFMRVFKKEMGITCAKYRKLYG